MRPRSERQRGRFGGRFGRRFGTGQSGSRILLVVLSFAGLAAAAVLAGHTLSQPPAPTGMAVTAAIPAERYTGVVRLAPDHKNRCQQFRLDNRTGTLAPIGSVPCGDTVATIPRKDVAAPPDTGDNRFKAMGDYFRAR